MFKTVSALMLLLAIAAPPASASLCGTWFKKRKIDVAPFSTQWVQDITWCREKCQNEMPGCTAVNWHKKSKTCEFLNTSGGYIKVKAKGWQSYTLCDADCGNPWKTCCPGYTCFDGNFACNTLKNGGAGECELCGGSNKVCCPGHVCHSDENTRRQCSYDRCVECGKLDQEPCTHGEPCDFMLEPNPHNHNYCVMIGSD